jgi:acyl-CoA thioesterase FadM
MTMQQRILRGEQVLAQGEVTIACVDRAGIKPRRMPADMVSTLRAAQG